MDKPKKPPLSFRERLLLGRLFLVRGALILAVLAPIVVGVGMFGVRQDLFDGDVGLDLLGLTVAPALAIVGGLLGVLALLAALALPPRRGRSIALLAVALAAATYGGVTTFKLRTAKAPPIHDVATDWTDPLIFGSTIMAARGKRSNPVPQNPVVGEKSGDVALIGRRIAEINVATCPAATPVVITVTPDAAFPKAKAALVAERMVIQTENLLAGRIEGTRTTAWYGFKDDVLIRIKPEGAGARLDLRGSRRMGVSDHGDNCALIGALRKRLAN